MTALRAQVAFWAVLATALTGLLSFWWLVGEALFDDGTPPPRIQRIELMHAALTTAVFTLPLRSMVAHHALPRLPSDERVMEVDPRPCLAVSAAGTWWSDAVGFVTPDQVRARMEQLGETRIDLALYGDTPALLALPFLAALDGKQVRLLLAPEDDVPPPRLNTPPSLLPFDKAYREVAREGATMHAAMLADAIAARLEPCPDVRAGVVRWRREPTSSAELAGIVVYGLVECDRDVDFDGLEHILKLALLAQYPVPASRALRVDERLLAPGDDTVEELLRRALLTAQ